MDDDDFSEKIQDIGIMQIDSTKTTEKIFSVQYGKDSYWSRELFGKILKKIVTF